MKRGERFQSVERTLRRHFQPLLDHACRQSQAIARRRRRPRAMRPTEIQRVCLPQGFDRLLILPECTRLGVGQGPYSASIEQQEELGGFLQFLRCILSLEHDLTGDDRSVISQKDRMASARLFRHRRGKRLVAGREIGRQRQRATRMT